MNLTNVSNRWGHDLSDQQCLTRKYWEITGEHTNYGRQESRNSTDVLLRVKKTHLFSQYMTYTPERIQHFDQNYLLVRHLLQVYG